MQAPRDDASGCFIADGVLVRDADLGFSARVEGWITLLSAVASGETVPAGEQALSAAGFDAGSLTEMERVSLRAVPECGEAQRAVAWMVAARLVCDEIAGHLDPARSPRLGDRVAALREAREASEVCRGACEALILAAGIDPAARETIRRFTAALDALEIARAGSGFVARGEVLREFGALAAGRAGAGVEAWETEAAYRRGQRAGSEADRARDEWCLALAAARVALRAGGIAREDAPAVVAGAREVAEGLLRAADEAGVSLALDGVRRSYRRLIDVALSVARQRRDRGLFEAAVAARGEMARIEDDLLALGMAPEARRRSRARTRRLPAPRTREVPAVGAVAQAAPRARRLVPFAARRAWRRAHAIACAAAAAVALTVAAAASRDGVEAIGPAEAQRLHPELDRGFVLDREGGRVFLAIASSAREQIAPSLAAEIGRAILIDRFSAGVREVIVLDRGRAPLARLVAGADGFVSPADAPASIGPRHASLTLPRQAWQAD